MKSKVKALKTNKITAGMFIMYVVALVMALLVLLFPVKGIRAADKKVKEDLNGDGVVTVDEIKEYQKQQEEKNKNKDTSDKKDTTEKKDNNSGKKTTDKKTTEKKTTEKKTTEKKDTEKKSATSGKARVQYNSTWLNSTVTIGGKSLKGNNKRNAILIGEDAIDLLPASYDGLLMKGYQWVIVHATVKINDDSVGTTGDCCPDISVVSSSGKNFNNKSTLYYYETLDKNKEKYNNNDRYDKEYDIVFQIPEGQTKFKITFGRQNYTTFTFSYTGQKITTIK